MFPKFSEYEEVESMVTLFLLNLNQVYQGS